VGVVHQARNPQQNVPLYCASLKVPEWLEDVNDLLKKILTEAKAASALDHSEYCAAAYLRLQGFHRLMTAEFIEGQNLKEMMAKRQPEMLKRCNWPNSF